MHTALDGDAVFALSTTARPAPGFPELLALHAVAADVVTARWCTVCWPRGR